MAPQFVDGVQLGSTALDHFRPDSCTKEGIGKGVDPHQDTAHAFNWQSGLCEC